MTHSLHRRGTKKSLEKDYVFLCTPAKGLNNQGATQKLLKVLDIVMDLGPSNIGFYGHGSLLSDISISEVKNNFHDNSRIRCSFDEKEKIKYLLQRLKSEDLGLSITLSGLIKEIKEISNELGMKPHTINISCGCYGKINRLPSNKILELTTMCGHGMISSTLVESIIESLKREEIDYNGATQKLGESCVCGIFNPKRALTILHNIMNK